MAALSRSESRRLYSWWWDSHISPKNSKWLHENLTDMDIKIKAMIKLIEEDADSFARRAEMYYKKRPELMKLVEEFYRAYRALAERYDLTTGALRQAHRTMAEVFPNHIPLALPDDSPSGSSTTEVKPHTPEMPTGPTPICALFEPDDLCQDALGLSSQHHAIKRNRAYSEESDPLASKQRLKQLNEMFSSGEGAAHGKFAESKVRKGLNFHDEERKGSEYKTNNWFRDLQKHEMGEKEDAFEKTKNLHEAVSRLSTENQNLKTQFRSESERASKAETEVQRLQEALSKSEAKKEAALLQYQRSVDRISDLENEISCTLEDFRKLNGEMLVGVMRLNSVEERCLLLEKENQSLRLELGALKQEKSEQHQELQHKHAELEELKSSIKDERIRSTQAEVSLQSLKNLHAQSQEELRISALEIESKVETLKDMELRKQSLEDEVQRIKGENESRNDQKLSSALMIKNLQDQILSLKETQVKLENEVEFHVEGKRVLQQELCCLKEEINDLDWRQRVVMEQIEAVGLNPESFQASVKELQNRNLELKEICKKHENENVLLLEKLGNMEKFSEKNAVLENSLSDATVELEGLREKFSALEESCEFFNCKNSVLISEKGVLVLQIENIMQNMEKLLDNNTCLENSLSDANAELEGLRRKLKSSEESCQSLHDEKANFLTERNALVSQVESIIQSLEGLKKRYAELEDKHSYVEREKESALHQVGELEGFLKLEKQEHESCIRSSKTQLAILKDHIILLQEKGRCMEEEFKQEEHKLFDAHIEIFILQRCLCELNERNLSLARECQKYIDASSCAERLITDLKQENLLQYRKVKFLSEHNEKLSEGINLVLKTLDIDKNYGFSDGTDDVLDRKLIYGKIKKMQYSILDARDENQNLHKQIGELRIRENHLISELAKEVKCYEEEVATLHIDIQSSTVHAVVFEENFLELIGACESLAINTIVQRKMLDKEMTSRNACIEELDKKLNGLEEENIELKSKLNGYLPIVFSLCNSISCLEDYTLSLTKRHASNNQEIQVDSLLRIQHDNSCQGPSEDHISTVPDGILELQKLQIKVEVLQKVLVESSRQLMQEIFDANTKLEAARKEIEELKLKRSSVLEEVQMSKDIIMQLEEEGEKPRIDLELKKDDVEFSKVKHGLMMKDIQLDHVLDFSYEVGVGSYGNGKIENAQVDDQMLELWETAEWDCNNQMQKAPPIATKDDVEYHQIEAVEEEKSDYPSCELVAEKELGVDKLEVLKKDRESHDEWNKRVLERLASDAERLSVLQTSVQELKEKMEKSEKSKCPSSFEYDTVKGQLKEAEEAILQLFDINSKLTKKAEACSAFSDRKVEELEKLSNQRKRQVSERARRGSEMIGRLELELQKIQYILLKFQEEHENHRTKAVDRRSRILLRDYLYGRRESYRRKKGHLCGCIRPKTKGD